jgi:hypothetical protein
VSIPYRSLAKAIAFECPCAQSCALKWTKPNVTFSKKLEEQIWFTYHILLAGFDVGLKTLNLTIQGKTLDFNRILFID